MRQRLIELKRYCMGWFHYFKRGLLYKEVREWDGWIRRRVRLCYWKDWKVPRKRRRMLIKLGVSLEEVKKASCARKGYWRMSQNSLVRLALNNTYLANQGVPSMRELWLRFRYGDQNSVNRPILKNSLRKPTSLDFDGVTHMTGRASVPASRRRPRALKLAKAHNRSHAPIIARTFLGERAPSVRNAAAGDCRPPKKPEHKL